MSAYLAYQLLELESFDTNIGFYEKRSFLLTGC